MSLLIELQFVLLLVVCYFISGAIVDAFPQGIPQMPDFSQIPGADKMGQMMPGK